MVNHSVIYTGFPMVDTEGKAIHAHAGGLLYENGIYYWYGENKEYTNGRNGIWTWGIRCYSSRDLYTWKDEGLIISPEPDHSESWLHPSRQMDRPHILRVPNTGKYVCWLKYSGKNEACFSVLSADNLLGPYVIERENFRPFGKEVGDFDVWQDSDGRTYLYFASGHDGVVGCELTADCLDVLEPYRVYYEDLPVPYCREGIAMVKHEGVLYMLTSGMTGYIPNPTEAARLDSPLGNLEKLGNPHCNDRSGASFLSQISMIFPHPEKQGLYIALADRWIPDLRLTQKKTEKLMRAMASCMDRRYHSTLIEKAMLGLYPWNCRKVNTSLSGYVWLPLKFENGIPVIRWLDKWKWEEIE